MFVITTFSGNHKNVSNGEVTEFNNFKELAKCFEQPQQGPKHHAYFVRGRLDPIYREDKNLAESNLLVLDADRSADGKNAPAPLAMHRVLSMLKLEHFIYTSHSHNLEQNKYRVVIPCKLQNKGQLKMAVSVMCNTLVGLGVGIENVKEMSTWTQPWFIPTRDDPTDGLFEYYYGEGNWFVAPEAVLEKEAQTEPVVSSNKTMDQMVKEIQDGTEYHTNLRNMIWGMAKDGMTKAAIKATITGIMNGCKEKDERWETRMKELDRNIDGAFDKNIIEDVDLSDVNVDAEEKENPIPWPPGLLGKLAQTSYEQQIYQYKEVAVVSAVGLVAGITGRKFNVMGAQPMGLNVYMTLIMSTGMGKEGIGNFMERHILGSKELTIGASFYGNGDFTSARAIINQFKDARSQVCVCSEAGLLLQTRSGNVASKTAMLLDMYSKSHRDGWTKGTTFSNADDSIPRLRAVAATIISEATPETLLSAYRDTGALDNGHLPRQSIFRVTSKRPRMNRNAMSETSIDIKNRLKTLISKCANIQAVDDPSPYLLTFDPAVQDDVWDYSDKCNDIMEQNLQLNPIKSKMATRMFVKAVKYAGIATVFNHENNLIIGEEEWNWGKQMVEYEMRGVDNFFLGSGFSDKMHDLVTRYVGPAIVRMLKTARTTVNKNTFAAYDLSQRLRNCTALNEISDKADQRSNPVSGFNKALKYMCDNGYLIKQNTKKEAYIITELFKQLMKDYTNSR